MLDFPVVFWMMQPSKLLFCLSLSREDHVFSVWFSKPKFQACLLQIQCFLDSRCLCGSAQRRGEQTKRVTICTVQWNLGLLYESCRQNAVLRAELELTFSESRKCPLSCRVEHVSCLHYFIEAILFPVLLWVYSIILLVLVKFKIVLLSSFEKKKLFPACKPLVPWEAAKFRMSELCWDRCWEH